MSKKDTLYTDVITSETVDGAAVSSQTNKALAWIAGTLVTFTLFDILFESPNRLVDGMMTNMCWGEAYSQMGPYGNPLKDACQAMSRDFETKYGPSIFVIRQ